VLEAYAHARTDRPDKYLERRARLAGELKLVSELLTAVGADNQPAIEACSERLRQLEAWTFGDKDDEPVIPTAPSVQPAPAAPTPEAPTMTAQGS
jgi:macrolide phosphotransferase